MNDLVYKYKNNLYLNITNRCTSNCPYCIKNKWDWNYRSYNLKLDKEPAPEEIINEIKTAMNKHKSLEEFIFCGYGEPFLRLDVVKEVSGFIKSVNKPVRINTNGHANLIHKRDICPELKGLVDKISISLNGDTSEKYYEINKPVFGIETFNAVLQFITSCKKYIPDITVTAVEMEGINIENCREIARKLDIKFMVRPFLDEYETK